MNGTIDTQNDVHCMSRRGSPLPTTDTRMSGSGSGVSLSSSSATRRRHPAAARGRRGGCSTLRPATRTREAEDDPPGYEMVCLPAEEKRAQPPYEVIPGDTAPNEREDQMSESGGLSRILNFELRCSQVSEEMICMRLMKTLSCVTRDVQARVFPRSVWCGR